MWEDKFDKKVTYKWIALDERTQITKPKQKWKSWPASDIDYNTERGRYDTKDEIPNFLFFSALTFCFVAALTWGRDVCVCVCVDRFVLKTVFPNCSNGKRFSLWQLLKREKP